MLISESLRRFRKSRGLTQQQVADAGNLHVQRIKEYENNYKHPNILSILKIADAFNVSLDYLTGRTENPAINR